MRNCILKGTWFDTSIRQGDIVNVLGLDEEVKRTRDQRVHMQGTVMGAKLQARQVEERMMGIEEVKEVIELEKKVRSGRQELEEKSRLSAGEDQAARLDERLTSCLALGPGPAEAGETRDMMEAVLAEILGDVIKQSSTNTEEENAEVFKFFDEDASGTITYDEFLGGSGDKEMSTTMAVVRLMSKMCRDKKIGKRVVPIVPDESRTFGMEGLFRRLAIYSSVGQLSELRRVGPGNARMTKPTRVAVARTNRQTQPRRRGAASRVTYHHTAPDP